MYKKIMVFGMVLLIMLCTPLPSYSEKLLSWYDKPVISIGSSSFHDISSLDSNYLNPEPYTYLFRYKTTNIYDYRTFQYPLEYYPSLNVMKRSTSSISYTNRNVSYSFPSSKDGIDYWTGSSFYDDWDFTINMSNYSLIGSSHDIYNYDGTLYYKTSNFPTQQFEGRITLPANDGYKDNGTTFTFWHWYQLPTGVDSSDVKIDPYIDDSKDTYHSAAVTLHQNIPNTSKWNLNINLTVREYGSHTYKVVFKQISTGKVLGTLTRTFEALEGFIDENGDGLDDRTGQPPYDPLEPPGDSLNPEWDGTVLGFFQYLIDSVEYYVQNIVDGINVTLGSIGKVPQIMGTILNFPEPLTALLIFGVTSTIILAIFRR